jgi:UDP-N-acetylmuramate--alanine ligase
MPPNRIHFMGIAGSGMSAVAQIAAARGFQISGCDLSLDSPYFHHLESCIVNLESYTGHSPDHLQNVDLLCVTPAVYYQSAQHPELAEGKKLNMVMKWQDFLGTYLHKDKFLIAVAGTHGKSTTTALTGLLLEKAGLDPTVEVGATVKEWHNNVRIGKSAYFISEADEFHDNFATYQPNILILTLVEYDHPEYFGSFENMLGCYSRLISRIKPGGSLIYNSDSPGCNKIIKKINTSTSKIKLIKYSLSDFPKNFKLSQPGNHNKLNALAIIKLAKILKINSQISISTLKSFQGLDRRLDLLGETHGIKVYDDYANHPSSFAATLSALRELYPTQKILAVIEPHTFSRLRVMLPELPTAFKDADEVIVTKIFASRETDPGDFTGADIAAAMHHPRCQYTPEFPDIVSYIVNHESCINIIVVMGSGNSYKLSRQILQSL